MSKPSDKRIDKRIIGIMCVIAMAATAIVVMAFWGGGFGGSSGKKGNLYLALVLAVPAVVLVLPLLVFAIRRTRVKVRKPLHPCAECGYELRGIRTGMCPECGHRYC